MQQFAVGHNEFMVDSNFAKKVYLSSKYYFALEEKHQALYSKKKYPLYPIVNMYNRYTWYLKSSDSKVIYELGLYYDGFALNGFCTIKNDSIDKYYVKSTLNKLGKIGKEIQAEYKNKFDKEILNYLLPYFKR